MNICVFKASENKRTTYCNLLVAEDQSACMFLRVIPTYLRFDSLCVIWRHFITLFFDITKVGPGAE